MHIEIKDLKYKNDTFWTCLPYIIVQTLVIKIEELFIIHTMYLRFSEVCYTKYKVYIFNEISKLVICRIISNTE